MTPTIPLLQPIPIIQTVTPSEIATYGRSTLEIQGEDIASMLFESKVFVGGRPCLNVVKLTPTKLQCTAPKMSDTASLGFTSVTVLIVTSNGTSTKVLKYGTPHVTSVLPRTVHSVGGQTVVVRGTLLGGSGVGLGFPDLPRIVLGGASCGNAKRTKNLNEFTCVTGAVSVPGKDLAATVTVAKGDDVTDNVVDVLPPQIIELTPTEGPTYGESVITIEGVGFGTNNDVVEAYVFFFNYYLLLFFYSYMSQSM